MTRFQKLPVAVGVVLLVLCLRIAFWGPAIDDACHMSSAVTSKTTTDHQQNVLPGGYAQAGVVSGAIFEGKPFRQYTGKRIFTKGWKKRIGRQPLRNSSNNNISHSIDDLLLWSHHTNRNCTKWSVVTTIFDPSQAILDAAAMGNNDWCMVIVGDQKTPLDFYSQLTSDNKLGLDDSVVFLDVLQQEKMTKLPGEVGSFIRSLPYNHFARKNIGFLYAILKGAQFIFDFDDDNYVMKDSSTGTTLNLIPNIQKVDNVRHVYVETHVFNHHALMRATIESSWPRGFPLERVQDERTKGKVLSTKQVPMERIGVMQICANENPDVDAVHRLTKPLPMNFANEVLSSPILVPEDTVAPYNAQATVHYAPAFFATLLPITVQSRVSDIWRAYYAAPLFRDLGLSLLFTQPKVVQHRATHNYLGDMKAEEDLYFKSGKLTEFVHSWKGTAPDLPGRMEDLWINLYERGYHEVDDVSLVQNWLAALVQIQYQFRDFADSTNEVETIAKESP